MCVICNQSNLTKCHTPRPNTHAHLPTYPSLGPAPQTKVPHPRLPHLTFRPLYARSYHIYFTHPADDDDNPLLQLRKRLTVSRPLSSATLNALRPASLARRPPATTFVPTASAPIESLRTAASLLAVLGRPCCRPSSPPPAESRLLLEVNDDVSRPMPNEDPRRFSPLPPVRCCGLPPADC